MSLDFRNTNTLWASIFVETLARCGLKTAIICPGSRSTPLTVAFARNKAVEAIPVLDERSAAFFALGIAKQSGLPVALVCTSGTAGANFYPAVIEARYSHVPLLILTADRPPELRECYSGQTIEQLRLYGNYPNWQVELALPSREMGMLRYLRQTTVQAWRRTILPVPGVVHLNIPLCDPLAPIAEESRESQLNLDEFFQGVGKIVNSNLSLPLPSQWQEFERGVIIAGVAQPTNPQLYCQAVGKLSQWLGFPVLGEGLSPIRNYADLNPYLVCTYDQILRQPKLAQKLKPRIIIQLGKLPTSKILRAWLAASKAHCWAIEPTTENCDPLHNNTTHLSTTVENIASQIPVFKAKKTDYCHQWLRAETTTRQAINQTMNQVNNLLESKISWLLSQTLAPETPLFIANSMPVRDVEFFWQSNNRQIKPFFSRGANGIDGTLSTALGIAYRQQSSVMLTGDLALLHDTNGFLLHQNFIGHLTILLINNDGGGIFEMLPIAQFEPPFEEFFAMPQQVSFAKLSATYGVEYQLIQSWQQLQKLLNPLPKTGIRILEIPTNRRSDAQWRKENLAKFAL